MKGHELFPGTDENPNPDVHSILVSRSENGAMMQAPFGYIDQAELPNVAALFSRFGGGVYELVARDGKKICSRVRMNVAGDPKPLDGRTAPAFVMPPASAAPNGGGGGNTVGTIIAAISALAPVFLGWMQMQGAQAQAQMQMTMAMINGKSADAAQQTQAMAQLYAAQTQQMGAMFAALAKGSGGGDGSESVVKGMEMMQELMTSMMQGGGGGEGGEGGNPVAMVEKIMGMFKEAKALADVAPLPPGAAAAVSQTIPAAAPVRDAEGEDAPEDTDDEAAE